MQQRHLGEHELALRQLGRRPDLIISMDSAPARPSLLKDRASPLQSARENWSQTMISARAERPLAAAHSSASAVLVESDSALHVGKNWARISSSVSFRPFQWRAFCSSAESLNTVAEPVGTYWRTSSAVATAAAVDPACDAADPASWPFCHHSFCLVETPPPPPLLVPR